MEKEHESRDRKLDKAHAGHDNHLCSVVTNRQMMKAAALSKDAKYLCYICGRAASKPKSLCEPVEI